MYVAGWNIRNDDYGATTPWGPVSVRAAIEPNVFYHVELVFDQMPGTLTGYLNGEVFGEASGVGRLWAHSAGVIIGGSTDHFYFKGLIDEVRVFDRALSATEIRAIYGAGSLRLPSPTPTQIPTFGPVPTTGPTSVPTPVPMTKEEAEARARTGGLVRADLRGSNLTGASLAAADLYNANLSGALLTAANLIGAILRSADLTGADLTGANLSFSNLTGANLTEANLSWADLSNSTLCTRRLSKANFSGAILAGASCSNATVSPFAQGGLIAAGAIFGAADLSGDNLSEADFSRADLSGTNFSGANLARADLSGAVLTRANLSQAILSEADFTGANLAGADFAGTDWKNAFCSPQRFCTESYLIQAGALLGYTSIPTPVPAATATPTPVAPTPTPARRGCLEIVGFYGFASDSTMVRTIEKLPVSVGNFIIVTGTSYYDGGWAVLQMFQYQDLWGYRIEKDWQSLPPGFGISTPPANNQARVCTR